MTDWFRSQRCALAMVVTALVGIVASTYGARAASMQTLYTFCVTDCSGGSQPLSGLIRDAKGNLYGTTHSGGINNFGVVYELERRRHGYDFHTIYKFCSQQNCADGRNADERLVIDSAGNLYGTTYTGGSNAAGVVFELTYRKRTWKYRILHNFCSLENCTDGAYPLAGLTYQGAVSGAAYDGVSPLYGTSTAGVDGGTAFKIEPRRKGAKFTVLYIFCQDDSCLGGGIPEAPLTVDSDGKLYGTAHYGGTNGEGTVFSLTPKNGGYTQSALYSFCQQTDCADGGEPVDGLALDTSGNLYGTTPNGNLGSGTLFKLDAKSRKYSLLHHFCSENSCADGVGPRGGVTIDANGDVLGTTLAGGDNSNGTIFRQHGNKLTVLYSFNDLDGAIPYGGVVLDEAGNMYGPTFEGGQSESGIVFEFTP